ncbi:MAG: pantoate--beta-alanine ligase [Rhizobiaceae bacterium]|nr:pantoate--beta-alanine ligase [Rhizobiaceae bacterium]
MTPIHTIADLRRALEAERRSGRTIGLVPTMGSLHRGHMTLVDRARAACEIVVVSIFVNPTQFGPGEDLATYPRDLDADLAECRAHGVDVVFAPGVEEIYPEPLATEIDVAPLSTILIGVERPGHFQGVATVVAKLFNIVGPTHAFFGEKDYQQLTVIRRMVRDLSYGIAITGVPTVREEDGLACSSRNQKLVPEDRAAAAVIAKALGEAERLIAAGVRDPGAIVAAVERTIAVEARADIRSVDLRDAETLAMVETIGETPVVVLVTVRFGDVLLIDQRTVAAAPSAKRPAKGETP